MYQAIVIDDEKWVVKSLIATIKNQDYFEITTEFYDGLSGLEYIRIHQQDLAFVDVWIPCKRLISFFRSRNKKQKIKKFLWKSSQTFFILSILFLPTNLCR